MEFTIDQILLMQDTIMDVRRRTQELTISEIVSRESRDRSSAIYSSAHNGKISLGRANGKLSRVLRS